MADAEISVIPVGTAGGGQLIRIMNESVAQIDVFSDGVTTANVTAGNMYAIIFASHAESRIYTVRSTAGTDAFSASIPTNFLQPTGTNGDSLTSALDALVIINQLNRVQLAEGEQLSATPMYDVNQDGKTTTAEVLGVSARTTKRNWAFARVWLQREMNK